MIHFNETGRIVKTNIKYVKISNKIRGTHKYRNNILKI